MELTLNRVQALPGASTTGRLMVNGLDSYATVERAPDDPLRIPAGLYRVTPYPSPRFQQLLAEMRAQYPGMAGITEVPRLSADVIKERDPIEIHVANIASEVEGCIGLGMVLAPGGLSVWQSREAVADFYPHFMKAIDAGEEVWLTVHDV